MHKINNKMKKFLTLNQNIKTISELLKSGEISCNELCNMCLNRIEKTAKLNAFVTVTRDIALQQSLQSQQRIQSGNRLSILDGIPIAIKDNFCTKNVRTSCASNMLINYMPPYNATIVDRLFNCGAVMCGKTNLDEYAMGSACVESIFGPTINPWKSDLPFKIMNKQTDECHSFENLPENDWHISGGSSGGSAVAVASGSCFAAIASDTGGSTRNPAARVGIVGFKPTYGLVSRYGLIALTHSMDVPGIMARSVDDVSLVLSMVSGYDPNDSTSLNVNYQPIIEEDIDLSKLRVGIPREYQCEGMSTEVMEVWKQMSDILSNCGAKVESVSLPHTKYSLSCYSVLNCCEVASNFSCYDGIEFGFRAETDDNNDITVGEVYSKSRREGFSNTVKERILAGNYFLLKQNYEKYFMKALKVRRLIVNDFENVFDKQNIDLLLTPVTLTCAPLYSQFIEKDNRGHITLEDYCTQPVNMAALPAVSIPIRLSNTGLPISLQLIGKHLNDFYILSIAKKLENILNFPTLIYDEQNTSNVNSDNS